MMNIMIFWEIRIFFTSFKCCMYASSEVTLTPWSWVKVDGNCNFNISWGCLFGLNEYKLHLHRSFSCIISITSFCCSFELFTGILQKYLALFSWFFILFESSRNKTISFSMCAIKCQKSNVTHDDLIFSHLHCWSVRHVRWIADVSNVNKQSLHTVIRLSCTITDNVDSLYICQINFMFIFVIEIDECAILIIGQRVWETCRCKSKYQYRK